MTLFGVILRDDKKAKEYLEQVGERFKNDNLIYNPFNAKVKHFILTSKVSGVYTHDIGYIFEIEPVYMNISKIAIPFFSIIYAIWRVKFFLITVLFFAALYFFWTKYFYYIMLRLGLRKAGYTAPVRLISNKEIIKEVFFNGTNRSVRISQEPKQKTAGQMALSSRDKGGTSKEGLL